MPRKRQLPDLKKLAQRGKVAVWLVDGAWVRTRTSSRHLYIGQWA